MDSIIAHDDADLYTRFVAELRRHWHAAGARPFHIGHRALAASLACSAGAIPRLMRRAVAEAGLIRRRHKNRYLLVIDHQRAFTSVIDHPLPADSAVIDHANLADATGSAVIDQPDAPATPEQISLPFAEPATPLLRAAPQPDAANPPDVAEAATVIDHDPPHEEDHDSCLVGVAGACAQNTIAETRTGQWGNGREQRLAALGFHRSVLPELLHSGVAIDELAAWLEIKAAQGARNPHGVVLAAIRGGQTFGSMREARHGTSRQQQAGASAAQRGGYAAGTGRSRRSAGGGRPPRKSIPQPQLLITSFHDYPRGLTLQQLQEMSDDDLAAFAAQLPPTSAAI